MALLWRIVLVGIILCANECSGENYICIFLVAAFVVVRSKQYFCLLISTPHTMCLHAEFHS